MPCSTDCGSFCNHQATFHSPLLVVLLCSFTWDSPCTQAYQNKVALCCLSLTQTTQGDATDATITSAQVESALYVGRQQLEDGLKTLSVRNSLTHFE